MRKFFVLAVLATFSLNANALSILLVGGNAERDVTDRLISLGHTVTSANAVWFGSTWDYSPYDVVAFQYGGSNPTDIGRLVTAVENNEIGVVFFRGWGANETAAALGITSSDDNLDWQYALNNLNIVDTSHYITQGMNPGINDLGYVYMSNVDSPGANTTVLAYGADAAALVVHNQLRVAITPFYGHDAGYDDETLLGLQLTERTLQWAAGATVVPIPAAAWLFISALAGLGWLRRKAPT